MFSNDDGTQVQLTGRNCSGRNRRGEGIDGEASVFDNLNQYLLLIRICTSKINLSLNAVLAPSNGVAPSAVCHSYSEEFKHVSHAHTSPN